MAYLANNRLFPTLFYGSSFMFCNFVARFSAVLGPQLAELPQPVPVIFLMAMSIMSLVVTLFMRVPKDKDQIVAKLAREMRKSLDFS